MSKITKAKRIGGITQVVERLLTKCKSLSLVPQYSTPPQKEKKNKQQKLLLPTKKPLWKQTTAKVSVCPVHT
jgi:hypothetical protein